MALAKKIFIYVGGVVALGLIVVIIFAGYLVLIPDSEIFGYHYLSGKAFEAKYEHIEATALSGYENLIIESGGFNLTIEPQEEKMDRVMVSFLPNVNGFTTESIFTVDYSFNYNEDTKTMSFIVNEPSKGLLFHNNAYIKIGLPNITREIDINVKSKGGNVTIGQQTPFGSLDPFIFETNSITIENTRAEMAIQNFTTSSTGTLSITNKSGRTSILGEVGSYASKTGDVIINSEIGSFIFGTDETVYNIGGNLEIFASNAYVKAGNVGGNVSQITESGYVELGTVNEDLVIETKNSETKIGKVLKTVTIESEYNTIEIGQIGEAINSQYQAVILLLNGNIIIDKCYYNLLVESARGNVTVKEAFLNVDIKTTYGDVDVTYNAFTGSTFGNALKELSIVTTEGNITAKNIKAKTNLKISLSSTATITAEFLEVNGDNFIEGGRREFTVKVPITNFNYKIDTTTGGINILAGSNYKTNWVSEDYNTETKKYTTGLLAMNGSVQTNINTLIITSSAGKINLLNNNPA